jgi:ATP-dependent protease ClpP protease subunit
VRTWYSMRAAADEAAEILIHDEIGLWGISAQQFTRDLKDLGSPKRITVRINSPGGDVFDGIAIFNALKRHPATVRVSIEGLAASIASIIAMAGDEIVMPENAMLMIHDPHALVAGTAGDMRGMADALDRIKTGLISAYRRSGQADEEIARLMAEETWMTAREAVDRGFADVVEQPVRIAASFDLRRFRRVPSALLTTEDPMEQTPHEDDTAAEPSETVTLDAAPNATGAEQPEETPAPQDATTKEPPQHHVSALAYAREVVELCTLAGLANRAAGFIRNETPVEQVRKQLLEARAGIDAETHIDCGHSPAVVRTPPADAWARVIKLKFGQ